MFRRTSTVPRSLESAQADQNVQPHEASDPSENGTYRSPARQSEHYGRPRSVIAQGARIGGRAEIRRAL